MENIDYTTNPCTTHPEFWLRVRAFLCTVAFLTINSIPPFLSYETVVWVSDFIFEAINCRPDGWKPTLDCLQATYLAPGGEYARRLQNDGTIFEDWPKLKTNWQHYWKESIVSFDQGYGPRGSSHGSLGELGVPDRSGLTDST